MNRIVAALALTLALGSALAAPCHPRRNGWQKTLFMRTHPCPANGSTHPPCPGWVIDHTVALCRGGADRAENMQWQTVAAAKQKDRWECKRDTP